MQPQCEELLDRPEARQKFLCTLRVAPTPVRPLDRVVGFPSRVRVRREGCPTGLRNTWSAIPSLFSRCLAHATTFGRRVQGVPLFWLHQFFHLFHALRGPLRDDIHRIGLRLACHFRQALRIGQCLLIAVAH